MQPKDQKEVYMMTKYEIMYVIRPTVLEDDRKALIEELNTIFTSRGAEVTNVNEWGMKDLAYEIEKHRKGYYVVLDVVSNDEARIEFDRVVRIKEDVIRYLILKDVR
jgi:small subunit ribosomal protein S6